MRFDYINQPPAENPDYHVARADIREADNVIRTVAYGATVAAAEAVLLDSIGSADIIDLGSV